MSALHPSDVNARRRALDPAKSFIVQAPAGSGKTELLIQRYLRLLSCVERPEDVLAITFTRKAAAEIRARVLTAMKAAAAGVRPSSPHLATAYELAAEIFADPARRDWDLLRHPARLNISTIDSLNSWLASRAPLRGGGALTGSVAEEPREIYGAAAQATLELVGEDGEAGEKARRLLRHLDNRSDRFVSLLRAMLPRRDQWLRHVWGAGHRDRRLLERSIAAVLEACLMEVDQALPADIRAQLPAVLHEAASHSGDERLAYWQERADMPPPDSDHAFAWRHLAALLLTKAGGVRKRIEAEIAPKGSAVRSDLQSILARCEEEAVFIASLTEAAGLPDPVYSDQQWRVLEALLDILPVAAAELSLVFAERGQIDFPQVAADARSALATAEESTELRLALDLRIGHILIDEFQDTSVAQFELLATLTEGWEPGDGRTLFMVGDPMQSIYRFREAEVGLFLKVCRSGLGALRPEFLQLAANYRSDPAIVDWVNRTFSRVLPGVNDAFSGAISFADSAAALEVSPDSRVQIHWLADASETAARTIRIVQELLRQPAMKSICILVRNRLHAVPVVQALREAGIGFSAPDIETLAHSSAAMDIQALARALCHRADRLAWLAILRAPWCGLALGDLHRLAAGYRDCDIWTLICDDTVLSGLSPAGRTSVLHVRRALEPAMCVRGRIRLRDLVEATWLRLAGPATLLEPADLDTAERFLTILETFDKGGDLVDEVALSERLAAAATGLGGSDHRVQIMTMHKAKGLEFDCVLLPSLERKSPSEPKRLLLWQELSANEGSFTALAPIPEDGDDPLYRSLQRLDMRKNRHEQARLLYVAVTRARRQLHLLAGLQTQPSEAGECRVRQPDKRSLLARLWPAVEADAGSAAVDFAALRGKPSESDPWIAPWIRSLPADWCAPPAPPALTTAVRVETTDEQAPEFAWATRWAMHVGAIVHRWLQVIAEEGAEGFTRERLASGRPAIRQALQELGTATDSLERATERVVQALEGILSDDQGRWILSRNHPEADCELDLTVVDNQGLRRLVIDRTFVDADGVRWVIDYKTSAHEGSALEVFLASELARYGDKLRSYADALMALDARPVRAALYFPLLGILRDVPGSVAAR
jgi:ATP-dependent exoDNAse (exonuclease V) beta subunit